jgi:DNA polymerase-1
MAQRKQLLIVDGHSLAFRAFHAFSKANLRSPEGEPTYAVFGFMQILLSLLQERNPSHVAIAFDVGRTFRHERYAQYKAGRAETPEEFHPQLERIKQLLACLAIPVFGVEHYEADDVIGTLARQATTQGIDTRILTGDTDTLQLVDEHVAVILANPYGQKTSTTFYDVAKVKERYKGLAPAQLVDLRGLKGDSSDNIPGVRGIGESGAITLLNQFGTVEQLYERLDEAPKRYQKALQSHRDDAMLSKELARIVCDVPITLDAQAARLGTYDREGVLALFRELSFGTDLAKKLPALVPDAEVYDVPRPAQQPDSAEAGSFWQQSSLFAGESGDSDFAPPSPDALGSYQAVTTEEALHEVVAALTRAEAFAFDTELNGIDPLQSALVGISLAVQPGAAWYIPLGHREGRQLERQQVLDALRPFFTDAQKARYAHNAKFDIEVLLQAGIETHSVAFDTMLAAGLLGKRMSLKEAAFQELNLRTPMTSIEELIGRGAKQKGFDQVPIAQAVPYAAADADMTLRLKHTLEQHLATEEHTHIRQIFADMEMPLIAVLVAMECAGIKLDVDYMHRLSKRLQEQIGILTGDIHRMAGEPFNINSGLQLNTILFERLNLPTDDLRKTSTGRYSLTADTLEKMRDRHEIIERILQYRHLTKLKSTYVDALPELVNPRTGRIHTSFNQMGAATGRLSSSNPNLQNIPVRSEEGGEIRHGFIAEPGHTFIAADYSQIELRILAHITQDANLVSAFKEGQDIHTATAAQLFHVAPAEVDKHQRRLAKSVVFGTIYGISSFGLAQRTDLSRSEAQQLIDAFFERFPGVRGYMDATIEQGRRDGYVASFFGRRRWMPELRGGGNQRQAAEREAINAPIQAAAADMMKLAMVRVANELQERQLRTRLLLQVHDELIFEAPDAECATVQALVRRVMENIFTLRVPLKVDVEQGRDWGTLEPVGPVE